MDGMSAQRMGIMVLSVALVIVLVYDLFAVLFLPSEATLSVILLRLAERYPVVPLLIGIVRPLVLLPASAVCGYSPEQVEMIVLHELAHVRRWDNLVNLVQRLVEAVLFFHPSVWWLSRRVRLEREHCCDAVVLAHAHAPQRYAEFLAEIALLQDALSRTTPTTVDSAGIGHAPPRRNFSSLA